MTIKNSKIHLHVARILLWWMLAIARGPSNSLKKVAKELRKIERIYVLPSTSKHNLPPAHIKLK
jgi:hypothetical protein